MAGEFTEVVKAFLDKFFDWKGVASLGAVGLALAYCLKGPTNFAFHVTTGDGAERLVILIIMLVVFAAFWLLFLLVQRGLGALFDRGRHRAKREGAWKEKREVLENLHPLEAATLSVFLQRGVHTAPIPTADLVDRLLRANIVVQEPGGWFRCTTGVRDWVHENGNVLIEKAKQAGLQ